MSRKELLKKSLGITEYPWSSDDEEPSSAQSMPEAHLLRRQTSEPRPSVADMPGTSGSGQQLNQPTSPTLPQARGINLAKADRNMFFSLLNSPKSRLCEMPSLKYVSPLSWPPVVHTPPSELRERSERPSAAADIQRMMPYKKLMRSLGSIRTPKSNSNLYTMPTRGPPRNAMFVPPTSSDAQSSMRTARVHCALKRLQASRSAMRWNRAPMAQNCLARSVSLIGSPSSSQAMSAETGVPPRVVMPPRASAPPPRAPAPPPRVPPPPPRAPPPLTSQPSPRDWMDEPVVVDDPTPADNADEVMEQPDNANSPQPEAEEYDATEQEPIDVDTSNSASGGVSLEEEIVEIDAPDEADGDGVVTVNVDGDGDDDVVTADVGLNEAAAAPTNEDTIVLQQASQETTRSRRERNKSPDDAEPYTVKEFNQSLLRLLECPVCLEWMEPPMSQCRRGHLVCGRCRARLASCPVCRTTFSSVRNRAMEGVAEMVRYPCRHGCGREVRLRRRATHEASCGSRRYHCPAPACSDRPPLPRDHLHHHFQGKHLAMLKIGRKHKFSLKVNSEQHDTWLITALHEYFYLRVDVDIRTWGVIVYVAYIGPKCNANTFSYEVSVLGQHNSRKLVYSRVTHSDLESSSLNVSRQDCFHLTLDQALNFLRIKNRHCEPDKFLDFNVEISKNSPAEVRDDSES